MSKLSGTVFESFALVHQQQVANYKNLKIENSIINLKGKLKLLLYQNRLLNSLTPLNNKSIKGIFWFITNLIANYFDIDFNEDKDISPSLKKDMVMHPTNFWLIERKTFL